MNEMKFIASSIVAMGLAWMAAAVDCTWKGGEGDLSDPNMWKEGIVPSLETGAYNLVFAAGEHVIHVDRDANVAQLFMNGDLCKVTFAGEKTITVKPISGAALELRAGKKLVVDGATLAFKADCYIYGSVAVRSGALTCTSSMWALATGAQSFELSGGRMDFSTFRLDANPMASYIQTGGVAKFPSLTTVSGNTVSVTGGMCVRPGVTITVPVGETVDCGESSNVISQLVFPDGSSSASPSRFYGDYVAVAGDYGLRVKASAYASIPHGITFGSAGDWKSPDKGTYAIRERLCFDTADAIDSSVSRTISANNFGMLARTDFSVIGGGTLSASLENSNVFGGYLSGFTLGESTTMVISPLVYAGQLYPASNPIRAAQFDFRDNSGFTMMASYNRLEAQDAMQVGEDVKFRITAPKALTAKARYWLIDVGPAGDASALDVSLEGDGFDGWSLKRAANMVWLDDGTPLTPTTTDVTEWCGGSGADLSTDANWSSGTCQAGLTGGNKTILFKTLQGDVVNDIDGLSVDRIHATAEKRGPVRMSGKPIKITNGGVSSSGVAVHLGSSVTPVIFANDVAAGTQGNFGVTACQSYVAFLGGLDVSNATFDLAGGEVLIGGTATVRNLHMNAAWWAGRDKNSALFVLNGGSLAISNQTSPFENANCSSLYVNKGGVLSFDGGAFVNAVAVTHAVFGRLKIGVPLSATKPVSFFGSGRVDVASTKSSAAAAAVKIGEKVRLCPASWSTVTADGEGPLTIAVETRATLGATADWTYGVADGVTTATAAADRALTVADHETLTVDTANPDTGAAQTITFADPIVASGAKLVKTGVGTLVLASADNGLATTDVRVDQGELVCGTAQAFGSLTAAAGATLSFGATAGLLATVTVNGDVSLEGAKISLTKAVAEGLSDWTPVLTVPSGKVITGVPVVEEGLKVKVVSNDDGSASLCCKAKTGLLLIFR